VVIQRRLFLHVVLPALVISLLLGAVCVVGVSSLNRLQEDRARLLANDVASLQAAQEMQLRLRQVRIHGLTFAMDPSPARRAVLDDDHAQFESALERARQAADDPDEQRLLSETEAAYRAYRAAIDSPARRPPAGSPASVYLAWADAHPISPRLEAAEEVIRLNRRSIAARGDENDELTRDTRRLLVLIGVAGPLAGLVGGVGVAWGLSRSHAQLKLQAEQWAAVGHLAAGVAHEVRNPLTGVKLLIEASLRPAAGPLTADELRMILGQLQRVERTVQGLLDFARPAPPVRRRLDFLDLTRQAATALRPQADARGVTLADDTAGPLPVTGDPDQLLSLISNVLLNAVEATPAGGAVRTAGWHRGDGIMEWTVRDTGPGIAPAVADTLFTPFGTGKPAGTGLGLSVARRVAEAHGGSLAGANGPAGGAVFTLTLPPAKDDHAEIARGG